MVPLVHLREKRVLVFPRRLRLPHNALHHASNILHKLRLHPRVGAARRAEHGQDLRSMRLEHGVLRLEELEQALVHRGVLHVVYSEGQRAEENGENLVHWEGVGGGHDHAGDGGGGVVLDVEELLGEAKEGVEPGEYVFEVAGHRLRRPEVGA